MIYRGIIFDFFGVICSEIAPFWLSERFSPERSKEIKDTIVTAADRGDLSQDILFETLAKMCGTEACLVESEWLSMAVIDHRLVKMVSQLRVTTKVGLLSNAPSDFVRTILKSNRLESLFDHITISSERRCIKPDNRIYTIVLDAFSLKPENSVMIDDNPDNISGAAKIGMNGILYESYAQLKRDLRFQE